MKLNLLFPLFILLVFTFSCEHEEITSAQPALDSELTEINDGVLSPNSKTFTEAEVREIIMQEYGYYPSKDEEIIDHFKVAYLASQSVKVFVCADVGSNHPCFINQTTDNANGFVSRFLSGRVCEDNLLLFVLASARDTDGTFVLQTDWVQTTVGVTRRADVRAEIQNNGTNFPDLSNDIATAQAQAELYVLNGNGPAECIFRRNLVPTDQSGVNAFECSNIQFQEEYVDVVATMTIRDRPFNNGEISYTISLFAGCDDD